VEYENNDSNLLVAEKQWGRYGGGAPVRKGGEQRSASQGKTFPSFK